MCGYNFLYDREGIWYVCNRCSHEAPYEGAVVGIELKLEKEEVEPDEDGAIMLEVIFRNKTDHEIVLDLEHLEIWLDVVKGKGKDDEELGNYGTVPEPSLPARLEGHGKRALRMDLKEIEWKEGKEPYNVPGDYKIGFFARAEVKAGWGEVHTYTEAEQVRFKVTGEVEERDEEE
jgi:hypothetical protein